MKVWPNLENILFPVHDLSCLDYILYLKKKWHLHCLAKKGNRVALEVNLNSRWVVLKDIALKWKCDHSGWLRHLGALGCSSWLLLLGGWALPGKSFLWVHTRSYCWTSAAPWLWRHPPSSLLLTTYPGHQAALVTFSVPPKSQTALLLSPLSAGVHPYFYCPSLHIDISLCFPLPSLSVSKGDLSLCPTELICHLHLCWQWWWWWWWW